MDNATIIQKWKEATETNVQWMRRPNKKQRRLFPKDYNPEFQEGLEEDAFASQRKHTKKRRKIKRTAAARAMCILAHGLPDNPKAMALHTCGKGHLSCVNPKHLRWGGAKENATDRVLHVAKPKFVPELSRELAEEIRAQDKLSTVLAVEYGLPASVILKILNNEIYTTQEKA